MTYFQIHNRFTDGGYIQLRGDLHSLRTTAMLIWELIWELCMGLPRGCDEAEASILPYNIGDPWNMKGTCARRCG